MPDYRKGAHTVYDIQYHFVWVTKYRYQVLRGDSRPSTRDHPPSLCQPRNHLLKGHISSDHVHLMVSRPPTFSPAQIAQFIKGVSSRKLQDEFPSLKKRYWGQHLWARGYFCGTVGAVTKEQIKAYIDHHLLDTSDQNFSIDI